MTIELNALNFFMPIFSFLFVFVLIYAVLAKTKVLGENEFVHLLISFMLAVFFIVNVSLVEFVQFSSAWLIVFLVSIFLILIMISFVHGNLDVVMKPAVAWGLLIALVVFFIISSAYVFNWAINWDRIWNWFYTDWFALALLFIIAGIVAWVLSKQ